MKDQNFPIVSNLIAARELLKNGNVNAAAMALEEVNERDVAIVLIERGDIEGAKAELEYRMDSDFSIFKIIQARLDPGTGKGFQKDVQKFFTGKAKYGTFSFRPDSPAILPYSQRTISTTTVSGLVGTDTRIDLMQFKSRKLLHQLIGVVIDIPKTGYDFNIPVETTEINVVDLVQGSPPGDITDPEWGEVRQGAPKILFIKILYGRQAFQQFSELGHEMLKDRLNFFILKGADTRIFYGTGSSGQAEGLYYNSDVEVIDGTSFGKETLDQMERMVDDEEAPSENRFYLVAPQTAEILKNRALVGGQDRYIIDKGNLNNQPYIISKRITEGHLWYGNYSSIVLSLWNRELLVNPFASSSGDISISEWQPYEVTIRQPGWIVCAENVN